MYSFVFSHLSFLFIYIFNSKEKSLKNGHASGKILSLHCCVCVNLLLYILPSSPLLLHLIFFSSSSIRSYVSSLFCCLSLFSLFLPLPPFVVMCLLSFAACLLFSYLFLLFIAMHILYSFARFSYYFFLSPFIAICLLSSFCLSLFSSSSIHSYLLSLFLLFFFSSSIYNYICVISSVASSFLYPLSQHS